jgi:hypothetical protein
VDGIFSDRRMEGRRSTNVDSGSSPFNVQPDFVGSTVAGETEVF